MIDFIRFCDYNYSKLICPAKAGHGRSGRYPDDVFIYRTNRRPLGHLTPAHSDFMSGRPCVRSCTDWTFVGNSGRWTKACRCKNQKRQVYQAEIRALIFAPDFAPVEHNVLKIWIFLNQTGILNNWWFVQRNQTSAYISRFRLYSCANSVFRQKGARTPTILPKSSVRRTIWHGILPRTGWAIAELDVKTAA